jgi:DNA helicase-2/ATP-dependent DNA helicase PcrA
MDPRSLLNEQQLDAVTVDGGATLVLAGPGSGKTRVLTHRIAYLIDQMGIPPYHILAVTFTNKAANEMKKRLESMVPERAQSVWLGTFHSICVKILRREARYLPVDSNFTIYDVDDQAALIKNILKDLNLNDKLYRPGAIQETISRAKNEMIMPKQYNIRTSKDAKIQEIYERYQASLRACNAMDFDDLLLSALSLLYENDDVREKYATRFEHVLVDEFQDTNQIQYELVRLLSSVHKNLFVVGDEDQSIYRWRGADYRNVLRFEEDYGNFSKVLLEQNYRSTQKVLDLARSIIDQNHHRTPKALFTERGSGSLVRFYNAEDDRDEADYVVRTIGSEIKKGISPASFAIMYRMNSQSRMLEEAFMKAGIPYRLVGAQRFYGRREVKDVIAFLKLVQNPKDEVSIRRVINVPPRKIGDKSVEKLAEVARLTESSLGDVLQE